MSKSSRRQLNYAVELEGKRRNTRVFHSNLMKPYREREAIVNLTLNAPEETPFEIPVIEGDGGDG